MTMFETRNSGHHFGMLSISLNELFE